MFDPTMLQLLVGAIGGVGVALARSRKSIDQKNRSVKRRQTTTPRRMTTSRKKISKDSIIVENPLTTIQSSKGPIAANDFGSRLAAQEAEAESRKMKMLTSGILACPSCGLEGSNSLLSEHFQSSPSHPYGKQETTSQTETSRTAIEKSSVDAHHSVLRNLLSVLVPPRAFGRRHFQQNEQSFPGFVHVQARPSTLFGKTLSMDN